MVAHCLFKPSNTYHCVIEIDLQFISWSIFPRALLLIPKSDGIDFL